ncbi:unnamed protein product [Mesocestoides corti]|uniref:Mitochondrial import receptor subunit TOM70 n=1 Tax=Mesocestoides corti TaxID=53468 RepID=A0A3P6HSS2_MESCO|nr:unnamed protein product [Mesocestoides corti]
MSGASWKKILLFGTPALIAAIAGIHYLYSSRKGRKRTETSDEILPRKDRPVAEVPSQTPLDAAIALKNRGNKNFKAGRYAKAIECYTEALEQCPPSAINERATFYQNRAAAQENLHQYEKAIEDCTAALELSPKYLKALNRRAHLYEKIDDLQNCLFDVTACCMLERFQNGDNVLCIDRVLKKLAQQLAKEEQPKLPRNLPSSSFIKNYLGSFVWNPFTVAESMLPRPAKKKHGKKARAEEDASNGPAAENTEEPSSPPEFVLPEKLVQAYEALEKALEEVEKENYEASLKWAAAAVKNFNSSPSVNLTDFEHSRFGDREKPESARARALLLDATYKALSGAAEEAKAQLLAVGETMFAAPSVRVNALIKAACLFMTLEQDLSGCLYTFQQALTLCPDCPDVYLHRGQINLLADHIEDAQNDLNEAVKLKPDFSVAQAQRLYTLYRRALSENKTSLAEQRVAEFKELTEKYPECIETNSLYAQVLTERGEFEASDALFAKAIELSPTSGMPYAHRGLLQLRWKQDQAAAMKWFQKGIEVDPMCELALELLGQLAMERGEFEEALTYFNRGIEQAKTFADLTHLISLREGVKAQIHACKVYNIPVAEMFASLQQEFQQKMAAAAVAGGF